MKKNQNILLNGAHNKPISIDIFQPEEIKNAPLVLFIHGFKGFKDWGHFNLIAAAFAEAGFCFAKFNFSHNGTTPDAPQDFVDLEAFGNNNFSIELDETKMVLDFLNENADTFGYDFTKLFLIGHSRGGGIAILTAHEDRRIQKLITWASVFSFENLYKGLHMEKWKEDGVVYIFNSRTQQHMPLYYQLYENYQHHAERLNIATAASHIEIPWLIAHGSADSSVSVESAEKLHRHAHNSELYILEHAEHTFGGKHPFLEIHLPDHTLLLVQKSIDFIKGLAHA